LCFKSSPIFSYIAAKDVSAVLLKNTSVRLLLLALIWILPHSRIVACDPDMQRGELMRDSACRDSVIHALYTRHLKHPSDPVLISQLAKANTVFHRDSALSYWQLLFTLQPSCDSALYKQAEIYYSIDSFANAAQLLAQASQLRPDRLDYMKMQALADYRVHHVDDALGVCENILKLIPSDADALLLSGIILRDQHKDSLAIERFDRCLKDNPGNIAALIDRADEYVLQKKYTAALQDYSAARADLSDDADVLNNIGICHYQSGSYKTAIDFFRKAVLMNHLQAESYFNKGISYYHLGEADTASYYIRTARSLWDSCHTDSCHACYLDAVYYLGMCYKKTGELTAAREQFTLLQKEKYHIDLSSEILYIDCSHFISHNWYYIVILFALFIGLIIAIVKIIRKK